jgi:hypothetical protein
MNTTCNLNEESSHEKLGHETRAIIQTLSDIDGPANEENSPMMYQVAVAAFIRNIMIIDHHYYFPSPIVL